MACPIPDTGQPITKEDLSFNPYPLEIPPDTLQLEVDCINVLEARVDINTFPPDYQQKIRDFWRFSATSFTDQSQGIAKMTYNTLDLI